MSKKTPRRPAHKQQPSTESADKYFQAGIVCAEKEDYVGAIQNMTRAIKLSPDLGRAFFHRGMARYLLGDSSGAIQDLAKSVELNSATVASFAEMGQMAGEKVMLQMVGPLMEEIFEAFMEAALIFFEVDDYKRALAALDQAAGIFDDEPDVYAQRGMAYRGQGNYAKAVADFSRAVRLDPERIGIVLVRGMTFRDMGQYDKALADFARYEAEGGTEMLLRIERGTVYVTQEQWALAMADFDRAIELDTEKSGVPLLMKIVTLVAMGQPEAAMENWKVLAELNELFQPAQMDESLWMFEKLYPTLKSPTEKLLEMVGDEYLDWSDEDSDEE